MRDKKDTGNDDVSRNVRKLLRKRGLKLMTHLVKNMYGTGQSSEDFIRVTVIALKKTPKDSE